MTATIYVRIPGWAMDEPVPGDLYKYVNSSNSAPELYLNGKKIAVQAEKGYAVITRQWEKGDQLELRLPMNVNRVAASGQLKFNTDRIALQRGPLVYCVEGADNNGKAWNIVLPENAVFNTEQLMVLTEPVIALKTTVPVMDVSSDGLTITTENKSITAIPYYAWCNRGANQMQVWLPVKIKDIKLNY